VLLPPADALPVDGEPVELLPVEDPLPLPLVPIADPAPLAIRALVRMYVPRDDPLVDCPLEPADEEPADEEPADEEPPAWSPDCTHPTSVTVWDEPAAPLRAPD